MQTRRITADWTISDSQTGHLRTDWRATVPAQTSKFVLVIQVQATEQITSDSTASDQTSKLRQDIPVQAGSCRAGHPSPETAAPDQTSKVRLDISTQPRNYSSDCGLTQPSKSQTTAASDHRSRVRLHPNSNWEASGQAPKTRQSQPETRNSSSDGTCQLRPDILRPALPAQSRQPRTDWKFTRKSSSF